MPITSTSLYTVLPAFAAMVPPSVVFPRSGSCQLPVQRILQNLSDLTAASPLDDPGARAGDKYDLSTGFVRVTNITIQSD